jgi:hypothetical protein
MHITPFDTLEPELPSDGREHAATSARSLGTQGPGDGIGLAVGAPMLRTLALVVACVTMAASPAALAKKRHPAAHGHAHAGKKGKRPTPLVRVQKAPPPTRVAAASTRVEPAPPPEVSTPAPTVVAPSPPVEHGPLGPQAGDDEVPGSRMKR